MNSWGMKPVYHVPRLVFTVTGFELLFWRVAPWDAAARLRRRLTS